VRRHTGRQAYSGLGADSGVLTFPVKKGESGCTVSKSCAQAYRQTGIFGTWCAHSGVKEKQYMRKMVRNLFFDGTVSAVALGSERLQ
jgi:hypothetical protein